MYQTFDIYNRHDIPHIWLCNPDLTKIGSLKGAYDMQPTLRFNQMSEFSFTFPEHLIIGDKKTKLETFDLIESKKVVLIDNLGYFIIQDVNTNNDGKMLTKTASCYSIDSELSFKKITLVSGSYQLWTIENTTYENTYTVKDDRIITVTHDLNIDNKELTVTVINARTQNVVPPTNYTIDYKNKNVLTITFADNSTIFDVTVICKRPSTSLLGMIFDNIPGWSISSVESELLQEINPETGQQSIIKRTFDISDKTVYDFLMNDVEDAFQCIFIYDILNKTIDVKTVENAKKDTSIYMSFDNLLTNTDVQEQSDQIVTALGVYGNAELSIAGVNPTNDAVIYDFSYFMDEKWMSNSLIQAIKNWESLLDTYTQPYKDALYTQKDCNIKLQTRSGTSTKESVTITLVGDGKTNIYSLQHNLGTVCPSILVRYLNPETQNLETMDVSGYFITYYSTLKNMCKIFFSKPLKLNEKVEVTCRNLGLTNTQAQVQQNYNALNEVKAARIEAGNNGVATIDLKDINNKMSKVEAQLKVINEQIELVTAQKTAAEAELAKINQIVKFESNFTPEQLSELSPYIIENTYQNDTFIVTDQMTLADKQTVQENLLKQGKEVLAKVAQPRFTFSVNAVNFMFLKEFKQFTGELQLGSIFNIRFNDNEIARPILLEMQYSFDDPTNFTLTFGNRNRLDDDNFTFSDLFEDALTAGTSSSFNQELWQKFTATGADTALNALLTEAWDAAKNEIINSTNQQIVLDSSGLHGRTQNQDGTYDDKQVWLTGKTLAFTKDGWNSVSLALGEIQLNGTNYYGLAAEAVVGNLIAGSSLQISNKVVDPNTGTLSSIFTVNEEGIHIESGIDESNNKTGFTLDKDGVSIKAGLFELTNDDDLGRMIYNKDDGFKLQSRPTINDAWQDNLYVDRYGNLNVSGIINATDGVFSGTVNANSGKIGGWIIDNPKLRSEDKSVVLNPEGSIRLNKFHITKTGVYFGENGNEFDWKLANRNGKLLIQGDDGLLFDTSGDTIAFTSNGYGMTFNGQPICIGKFAGGTAGTYVSELRSGSVPVANFGGANNQFAYIHFNPAFAAPPNITGNVIYKSGYGTSISNSLTGAISVKFSEITTTGCAVTIGTSSGSWTDVTKYFSEVSWVAMGNVTV